MPTTIRKKAARPPTKRASRKPGVTVGSGRSKKSSAHQLVPSRILATFFILIVGGVGSYFLWRSFADTSAPVMEYSPNTVLLKFKDNVPQAVQDKLLVRFSARTKDNIPQLGVKVITVPDEAVDAVTEALSHNPAVQFAEKDGKLSPTTTVPNDSYYYGSPPAQYSGTNAQKIYQWPFTTTQTDQLWDTTMGSATTRIAVLDTGFIPTLADAGTFVDNWNVVTNSPDVTPINPHGVYTSGIVNARTNNGVGVASTCGNCSVIGVRISTDSNGSAYWSDIAKGLTYAADHGAKIVNISFAGSASSSTMQSAEQYALNSQALIFAAAGNSGSSGNPVEYPAADPGVIGVAELAGSTDNSFVGGSEHGTWVPIAAPGGEQTTWKDGSYNPVGGTSMASPFAAGVTALVWSAYPSASPAQIKQAIFTATDPITGGPSGYSVQYGRINGYKALQLLRGGTIIPPADTTAPKVAISSPATGATIAGVVSVNVTANDNVGITKVEFYRNGTLVGTTTTSPYSFYWDTTTVANGSYALTAKGYDAAGNASTSNSVAITVNNSAVVNDTIAPLVTISSPTNGASTGNGMTITANATDNVGVTAMEVYIDGALKGSSTNGAFSGKINTRKLTSGTHLITVKAYDAAGNVGIAQIQVTK